MKKRTSRLAPGFSTGLPSDYKSDERILAPIPGTVTQVFVKTGERVIRGTPLLIIEAMKMRNLIRSAHDLKIMALHAEPGQAVKAGELLLEFEKK